MKQNISQEKTERENCLFESILNQQFYDCVESQYRVQFTILIIIPIYIPIAKHY